MPESERSLAPIESAGGAVCVLALDHRDAMRNAFAWVGVGDVTAEAIAEQR